jgi:hypothetical protein
MSTVAILVSVCFVGFAIFVARHWIKWRRRQTFRSGFTLREVPEPQEQCEDPLVTLEEEGFDLDYV